MIQELGRLLVQNGFLPHGYCLSWSPLLVGTYVVSDALIALSYFSMPLAMAYFAWRRPDFPYKWLLWMFVAFILSCGTTHLMGTIILWKPLYWVDATVKAITAVAYVATAIVHCEWYNSALYDDQGRLVSIQSQVLDVTERERAIQALQESETRFRATFEKAAVGMAHVALDGHWLRVNDRLCRIVGYGREALLGLAPALPKGLPRHRHRTGHGAAHHPAPRRPDRRHRRSRRGCGLPLQPRAGRHGPWGRLSRPLPRDGRKRRDASVGERLNPDLRSAV